MRLASLQPSISVTLSGLGALELLCAHTKYCVEILPELAGRGLTVVQDCWSFDRAGAGDGGGELERLLAARPDVVLASVPYRIESLAAILKAGVPVIALAPHSLAGIYADMTLIASVAGVAEAGAALIGRMRERIAATKRVTEGLREGERPLVYCEEWGRPLIHSQEWVAELVGSAGGRFLGTPGGHTTAEAVAAEDPDVLLFAWCGAGDRVPLARVIEQRGWQTLRAVRTGRVHCIPDQFLNTPAQTLLEGLACIAAATHPGLYPSHAAMLGLTVADRERLQRPCPIQ